jgi:CheY-like chemotaxis protein
VALRSSLIGDDDEWFLEVARGILEQEGLRVAGVASASADAFRQVRSLDPDLVLVDVFLGDESGLELARRLVDDGRTVILISTHPEEDVAALIADSPVVGYLQKDELSAEATQRIADGHLGDGASGRRGRSSPRALAAGHLPTPADEAS